MRRRIYNDEADDNVDVDDDVDDTFDFIRRSVDDTFESMRRIQDEEDAGDEAPREKGEEEETGEEDEDEVARKQRIKTERRRRVCAMIRVGENDERLNHIGRAMLLGDIFELGDSPNCTSTSQWGVDFWVFLRLLT